MNKIKRYMLLLMAISMTMSYTAMPMTVSAAENFGMAAVNAEFAVTPMVIVYKAMSRANYLDMYDNCYDEAKKQASAYGDTLNGQEYTDKEITDQVIAYFEEIFEKILADNIKACALYTLEDLEIDEDTATFDSVYPIVYCSLTEKQLQSAEKMEAVTALIRLDEWTTPKDAGILPINYVESTYNSSDVLSDKLLVQINSGNQAIEVTMVHKLPDYGPIIQEVREKGESYKNSLALGIYTADEINEMTGYYKEQLNAELCAAAEKTLRQEICHSLGIALEDVNFVSNRMICTLTPEQIMIAAKSDWLKTGISLREEYVSVEDLGYEQVVMTTVLPVTTTTQTTTTTITATDTETTITADTTAEEIITDIAQIRTMLTAYIEENGLDAKIVSDQEYPGYQPIVVEYNLDAEVNTGRIILTYIDQQNIDRTNIGFVPIEDGVKMTTANPDADGTITQTTTTTITATDTETTITTDTTAEEKITDIAQIRMMLTAYIEENGLDAKIVSDQEYPGYQPIVVEYNLDAEVNTGRIILTYIDQQNIDRTNIGFVPIEDGVKMTTANPDADGTITQTTTTTVSTPAVSGDANDPEATLPQTGYSNVYKMIVGLATFMIVTGTAIVVKTKKDNE